MAGVGWLEQLGIRVFQLPTKLKLMLKLSLEIIRDTNYGKSYCSFKLKFSA